MIPMIWINGIPLKKLIQELLHVRISFGVRRLLRRKTTHQHLFLPKNYSGNPTESVFTPSTLAEVETHRVNGWGEGSIKELQLEFIYGPELEVSRE